MRTNLQKMFSWLALGTVGDLDPILARSRDQNKTKCLQNQWFSMRKKLCFLACKLTADYKAWLKRGFFCTFTPQWFHRVFPPFVTDSRSIIINFKLTFSQTTIKTINQESIFIYEGPLQHSRNMTCISHETFEISRDFQHLLLCPVLLRHFYVG